MGSQISDEEAECRIISNSTQAFPQGSSPHTPTHMRHHSSFSDVFDDYKPSEIINDDSEDDYITEDDLLLPDPAPSGRSSISSFPASVVHHDVRVSQTFSHLTPATPSRSRAGTPISYQQKSKPISPLSTRDHVTGFRNPSSVRALQMQDEFSDCEDLTPNHRRRGSRMSFMSYRSGSAHSTPGKRMSRSLQASPVKNASKLRKEFPLVLLHCSILPSMISPRANAVSEELLEAIIPEPYKKRWKMLQEKVLRNAELRERGVLIPHPKEDYDVLQEHLLESIELEQPVIRNGHYIGRSESRASTADSGFGSEETSSRGEVTDEEAEDVRCVDCGGHLCGERRWEVKVFAANGLMKAGAWSAAWPEMEKVDIQVSVWLPEDMRLEIEARLDAVIAQEHDLDEPIQDVREERDDARSREIYGENGSQRKQEDIDGLGHPVSHAETQSRSRKPSHNITSSGSQDASQRQEFNLQTALSNYVSLVLQDKRNIAILILSMILVIYCVPTPSPQLHYASASQPAATTTVETKIEYQTSTLLSTTTLLSLETSTILQNENTIASSISHLSDAARDDIHTMSDTTKSLLDLPADALDMVMETVNDMSNLENQHDHYVVDSTPPPPADDEPDRLIDEL